MKTAKYSNIKQFRDDFTQYLKQGSLIFLMRHGESLYNRLGLMQGDLHSPLTDKGRQQALCGQKVLKEFPFTDAMCSSLIRAQETAEIILQAHNHLTLQVNPQIIEVKRGILQARSKKIPREEFENLISQNSVNALAQRFQVDEQDLQEAIEQYRKSRHEFLDELGKSGLSEEQYVQQFSKGNALFNAPPHGESLMMASHRADKFRQQFLDTLETSCMLIVSHGMFSRLLILRALGVALDTTSILREFPQDNCCINVLWKPNASNDYKLLVCNDNQHILAD